MTAIEIRRATADDAPAIAAIHAESWQATYRDLLDPGYLESLTLAAREPMWTRILSDPATSRNVFVAIRDGTCTGFCSIGSSSAAPGAGMLHTIYLRPGAEGNGIGHALIERAELAMIEQDYTTANLWVLRDNTHARRFYERHGWVTDGTEQHEEIFGQAVIEVRYVKRLVTGDP